MSDHQAFADALLAAESTCPPGLTAWNGSDPGRRFAVYRNNVAASLVDALAETYPVTQALVGEEFFRAMAGLFVRTNPPRTRILSFYGDGLADFIEAFTPAASLPYLADVARLEMLRVRAYHAEDATPLDSGEISRLLADEGRLPQVCFDLHPSLALVRSRHALVSLWAAHQAESVSAALAAVVPDSREAALVLRSGLDVEVFLVPEGSALFIMNLRQGIAFGPAAGLASAGDAAFDLAAALGLLIRSGAITSATIAGSIPS